MNHTHEQSVKHGSVAHETVAGSSARDDVGSSADAGSTGGAVESVTGTEGVPVRILTVARRLFAGHGYDATSVRQIAEGVGVTVPALYYHFGSKRGILEALVDEHCTRKSSVVEQALAAEGTWTERLAAGMRAYVAAMSAEASTATIVMRDPSLSSDLELKKRVFATEGLLVKQLAAVVTGGVEAGEFRPLDPDRVAVLLLTAARGVHFGRMTTGEIFDTDALADTLLDLALGGLLT